MGFSASNRTRFSFGAARPACATLVGLRAFEYGLDARDFAIHELEDFRVEDFVRLAHPFGHGESVALIGPTFDVSAAHEVKRGKNQLALHVDDRKVRILVSGDERVLTVVQLLATADTEHVLAWGL